MAFYAKNQLHKMPQNSPMKQNQTYHPPVHYSPHYVEMNKHGRRLVTKNAIKSIILTFGHPPSTQGTSNGLGAGAF